MIGSYEIHVETARVAYDFKINRNITLVQGEGASGKTLLCKLITNAAVPGSNIKIATKPVVSLIVVTSEMFNMGFIEQNRHKNCIFFIDEADRFSHSKEFAQQIKRSNAYFVIFTRDPVDGLPCSVQEIYTIKDTQLVGRQQHKIFEKKYPQI